MKLRPRVRYNLLKDGKPVYESAVTPTYAKFLMDELKPNHIWTIEEVPTMPYTLAEETEAVRLEMSRVSKRLRELQERGVE